MKIPSNLKKYIFAPLDILSNLGIFGVFISMFIAFLIGTHTPIILQFIFIAYLLLYMNSWNVKQGGLASIPIIFGFILTIVALIGGNISWYIQTDYQFDYNIIEAFFSIFKVE